MSNETEKIIKELMNAYAEGGSFSNEETAYDYIDLAAEATSKKKKLEYLNKALELEPDNLDAASLIAQENAKRPGDLLDTLPPLIEKGNKLMADYLRDDVGEFWLLFETRPYMRLRHLYMNVLYECGMMRKAVAEAKEMLKLCKGDNLGVRYDLMHLYAYLEEEKAALALHKKYGSHEETQMLLPLAVLYYKKGDFDSSLSYLQRLWKVNKDTKKFFTAVNNGTLDQYFGDMSPYGYRPDCIGELIYEFTDYKFLFETVKYFFVWAKKNLKK